MPSHSVTRIFEGRIRALVAFIIGLAALTGAINTIASDTKPWVCSIGLPLSWCKPPQPVEVWSDNIGGKGGDPFGPLSCGAGQVLIGLQGREDGSPWTYTIGPVCADATRNWRRKLLSIASDHAILGDDVGSRGRGRPFVLKCPAGAAVTGFDFDTAAVSTNSGVFYYLVLPLSLRCRVAGDSKIQNVSGPQAHQGNASHRGFSCPGDATAFAIRGSVGQLIDALAIGCRS